MKIAQFVLMILFLIFSKNSKSQFQINFCNMTNKLDISTGFDHETNSLYNLNDPDQYWSVVSGPTVPEEVCATVQGWKEACLATSPFFIPGTTDHRVLKYGVSIHDEEKSVTNTNCSSCAGKPSYVFERRFRVNMLGYSSLSAQLDMSSWADDIVMSVQLIDPSNAPVFNLTKGTGCSEAHSCVRRTHNFNLNQSGEYKLHVTVGVRGSSILCNTNGTLQLDISGHIEILPPQSLKCLVRNEHWGKRVPPSPPDPNYNVCAPSYGTCNSIYQSLFLGNKCVPTGSTHNFLIGNYCSSSTYTVTEINNLYPPITATPSGFAAGPGNYQITVTDANNCSYQVSFDIGQTDFIATPVNLCVPPPNGTTGVVIQAVSNTIIPIPMEEININNGGWQSWTPSFSLNLGIGNHLIEMKDVNGCISSHTVSIGNDFTAYLNAMPQCFNGAGTLIATTYPLPASIVGTLNYDFRDFSNTSIGSGTNNTRSIINGGPYSVVVSDGFGCSATASTTAFAQPNISLNVPTGQCPKIITAAVNPPGGNPLFSWNGGTPTTNNTFLTNGPGVYTVTVTDGPCVATASTSVTCTPCLDPLLPNAHVIFPDGSAVSQFYNPPAGISTVQDVVIEGDFYIDIPFQISNCPNVKLGPDAHIIVNPGQYIHIDNSTLQAGCPEMWKGLTATTPSNTSNIAINIHLSTLQDMEDGVRSINGAGLNITDNIFTRNNIGLQVHKSDPAFNIASGRSVVMRNVFTSDGQPLLPACSTCVPAVRGEHGIVLQECQQVEIGADAANFSSADGNDFLNIYNGIIVRPDEFTGQVDQYHIRANQFFSLADDYNATSYGNDFHVHNNVYSTHRGSAIYCRPSGHMGNSAHAAFISGSANESNFYDFHNCDKAVVLWGLNAKISHTKSTGSLFGYMMNNTDGHTYSINNNLTEQAFVSTVLNGNTHSARIMNNYFKPKLGNIQNGPNQYLWPKGIEVNDLFPSGNPIHISSNTIEPYSIGGEGIVLNQPGPGTYVGFNIINFLSNSTAAGPGPGPGEQANLYGIRIRRGEESVVEENTIQGQLNYQALLGANLANRWSSAIGVENTKGLTLKCNHMDNTNDGFRIESDCSTAPDLVFMNEFHDHVVPMLFMHLGTEGTLGDIGSPANNTNNTFSQGNDPQNWPAPHNSLGQFGNPVKLYRVTNCPTQVNERFYSDFGNPFHVVPNESWSSPNNGQCIYIPDLNNTYPHKGFCKTGFEPLSIMAGDESLYGDGGIDIAVDSVQYSEYNEVAEWMDENYLYRHLDKQPSLRIAHTEYSNFYTAEQTELTDEIWTIDENLALLNDSTLMLDTTNWQAAYSNVQAQNALINSSKAYENNEPIINALYLKNRKDGLDVLTATDKTVIHNLAHSCPFVAGNAVFKARMLNAMLEPGASYNDRKICNAAGVYKNGGPMDGEDALIHQGAGRKAWSKAGSIQLYPNPTTGAINIEYEIVEDAELIFYDILGREMTKIRLAKEDLFKYENLNLPMGVYVWKCIDGAKELDSGKLIIE
jgi:hypothetical protein